MRTNTIAAIRRVSCALLLLLTGALTAPALAAAPPLLNYQGFLTDETGVPIDDDVLITFAIYSVPAGGVPLWSEGQLVTVDQGLFSVQLGALLALPADIADAPRYIGVTISIDPEMLPRREITASMFALEADNAVQLAGEPASAYDQSAHVTDTANPHSVTASQTGAATTADIDAHAALPSAHHGRYSDSESVRAVLAADGPGSGLNADLLDGVSSANFVQAGSDFGRPGVAANLFEGGLSLTSRYVNEGQANSITNSMILANAVGAAEIATGAVGASEIAPAAVGASEIAADAVGSSELDFSINHSEADANGGLISLTNTSNGSSGNYPVGLLGQASGSAGAGQVIAVGGFVPGLGAGAPVTSLPSGQKFGVAALVDSGTGVAAIANSGMGLYADGTTMAIKAIGINGPTNGYAGVAGTLNFDGIATVDISGFEIGLLGVSTGASVSDNYGVYGSSNNVGVFGFGARLAGEFVGAVKVGANGRVTLDDERIEMRDANGATSVVIDASAKAGSRIQAGEFIITGGADVAENFDVAGTAPIEAGSVLSIDPARAGTLTLSVEPYDRKVAGIVSGAGGVRPGVVMGQRGSIADGDFPVALSGRVYVKADASQRAIRPGDLLTTAARPGYAMRVEDYSRAPGAIIGKAMTSLAEGTGLVLVLVALQ